MIVRVTMYTSADTVRRLKLPIGEILTVPHNETGFGSAKLPGEGVQQPPASLYHWFKHDEVSAP